MAYLDNIAILDIETTGLDRRKCAVRGIGIVSYRIHSRKPLTLS